VSGDIGVTNPATGDASGVKVTDATDAGGTCVVSTDVNLGLDPTTGGTLPGDGGTADYPYTCTFSSKPSGKHTNTATVSWNPNLSDGSVTPSTSFPATADFTFGDPTNVIHDSVNITDLYTFNPTTGATCSGIPTGSLSDSHTYNYTCTVSVPSGCVTLDNTATFTVTDADGDAADDTGNSSVTAKVCRIAADLSGSKNATPAYTREYNWSIRKGVDACAVVNNVGGCNITGPTKVLNYTVTVTKNTGTESGWKVSGDIGVTNPDAADVSGVKVTDATNAGAGSSCVVSTDLNHGLNPAAGGTLLAGYTADYPYTCTFSSKPIGTKTNTATVTWNPTLSDGTITANSSLPATADFTFGDPTTVIHNSVNITDVYTFSPTSGATCSGIPSGSINSSTTYQYTCTVSVPRACVTLNNTATFTVTTADSDTDDTGNSSVAAKVCRIPASTGALTMGFWQNSNGQGLIKTYCNGTALRTFLLSFAPFQDLSASASCTDIASYVSTKIGLANCGGATCNAMLKAQDLATTLDVFFTGPGWTGSKIGSVKPPSTFLPNSPLGNVQIDLTQICNMTDGSGGSGTCSGSFAPASSVFGGAPCLYVYNTGQLTDILRYAAGQSDVGGTLWYANNKANQVLAKNVFDAINNQAAFSCT